MIEFRKIDDCEPALRFSLILRATEQTFAYISEHGSIWLLVEHGPAGNVWAFDTSTAWSRLRYSALKASVRA